MIGDVSDEEKSEGGEPEGTDHTEAYRWVTPIRAFQKYGKGRDWLTIEEKAGRIRTKSMSGSKVFSVIDIEQILGAGGQKALAPDMAAADLLRAASAMMGQIQAHHEKMFGAYQNANKEVLDTLKEALVRQNDQVIKLEDMSLKMREVAENSISQEQARKLEVSNAEHAQKMKEQALGTLVTTLGPWVKMKMAEKMGGVAAPTPGASPDEGQARLASLGQVVLGMLAGMTDEKFASLRAIVGDDEHDALSALRAQVRGAS